MVNLICETLDELAPNHKGRPHRELITFVADRPGHDFRYAIDFSKLKSELGWRPRHSFESGFWRRCNGTSTIAPGGNRSWRNMTRPAAVACLAKSA